MLYDYGTSILMSSVAANVTIPSCGHCQWWVAEAAGLGVWFFKKATHTLCGHRVFGHILEMYLVGDRMCPLLAGSFPSSTVMRIAHCRD